MRVVGIEPTTPGLGTGLMRPPPSLAVHFASETWSFAVGLLTAGCCHPLRLLSGLPSSYQYVAVPYHTHHLVAYQTRTASAAKLAALAPATHFLAEQ